MNHHALTLMILNLNHLLDTGRYDDITLDEVNAHIKDGSILEFIRTRAGKEVDFSILLDGKTYGNFERFYVTSLQSFQDAYGGEERRKFGVSNRGLCALIAWTNEILQQGTGWRPNLNMAGVEYP